MKIVTVVGARPNFVKMAAVSAKLRRYVTEIVIHTGQHYDYEMDRVFFDELGLKEPSYHLQVGSGTHGLQTGEMLQRIEGVLLSEEPDLVLVYGDVNTTLAGALAAAKLQIPVGHVEAGLRSFDRRMPEELNRVLTDHCSDLLFCPTSSSVTNLRAEAITQGVHLTGDVIVEALKENVVIAERKSRILDTLCLQPGEYYLATIHRAESTDNYASLKRVVDAFCEIGSVVLPCHPRTEKRLKQFGLWGRLVSCITVTKPVGYHDMLVLEKNAGCILTDSGGIQKEAYLLAVPCITLRERTEWVETVSEGWNVLVGTDAREIVKRAREFRPAARQRNALGDGSASRKLCEIIVDFGRGLQ